MDQYSMQQFGNAPWSLLAPLGVMLVNLTSRPMRLVIFVRGSILASVIPGQ